METIAKWTGADACRLQAAYRMSNEAFAARLGVAARTVAGWHQRARTVPQHEMQRALDVLLERADSGVLGRFHGETPKAESGRGPLAIRSHKFITAFPGPAAAASLAARGALAADLIGGNVTIPVPHETGTCTLHVWPHGVAVAHLVEEPPVASLSELAAWRYGSYPANTEWLTDTLGRLGAGHAVGEYVLSAYWLTIDSWPVETADRAARVACMPRVLCGDQPETPADIEARLLTDGFDHPDLIGFGVPGSGIGYASWSGVAYAPLDPARALPEQAIVDVELSLQAVWTYCARITGQVEAGTDPDVPPEYGWRWLRAARSRLITPRPQEPNPHRSMREAIVSTSGLPGMIGDAMTATREAEQA